MSDRTHTRRERTGTPLGVDRTDYFIDKFKEAMGDMFPKPADPPAWVMPGVACFSVHARVVSETDTAHFGVIPLELERVSSVVADKAGEFLRFLALELAPGETMTVTVERHEDVPIGKAAPVVMPKG
jgi:hypothetical protein